MYVGGGGGGGTVPHVLIHSTAVTSWSLTSWTEVSANDGQDAASAHGLSQCGSTQNNSAAVVTCTLSYAVRRHSLSWLMAQKQEIPEVKNRVGQAHGQQLHAHSVPELLLLMFWLNFRSSRLPAVETCTAMRAHQSLTPPPRVPFLWQPCHY
jgi:hypothetical protein